MHLSEYAFPSVAFHCTPSSLFEMKIITIIVPNNNKPIIPNSGRTEGRQVMIWVCVSVRTKIQVSNFLFSILPATHFYGDKGSRGIFLKCYQLNVVKIKTFKKK